MTDTLTPALAGALGALEAFASRLPPDTGADLARLAADLETAIKSEVDAAIEARAAGLPVVGPLAARIMADAANKALDEALSELTAAKGATQ